MSDQASIQQAGELAERARVALRAFRDASQADVDRIVEAMAEAGAAQAEPLARLARDETGYGRASHKVIKNLFCTRQLAEGIRGMRTVGVIRQDRERRVVEIAEPAGVVAGLVPV